MTDSSESVRCSNCSKPLAGDFCSHCGQRNIDFKKDWQGLVSEYVSSLFNFDGKVPRGVFDILLRPGYSSKAFIEGKRVSQIPPLRLYLFACLIFFIWFNPARESGLLNIRDTNYIEVEGKEQVVESKSLINISSGDGFETSREEVAKWLPRIFLLGVPLLALLTQLLFLRRKLVFLEHIIISIHLQTFFMLWVIIVELISSGLSLAWPTGAKSVSSILLLWLLVYPVLALKRLLDIGWIKAALSTVVLLVCYFAAFVAGIIGLVNLTS